MQPLGRIAAVTVVLVAVASTTGAAQATASTNWPLYGFSDQNAFFNPVERTINASNVKNLKQLWSASPLSGPVNTASESGGLLYALQGVPPTYNYGSGLAVYNAAGCGAKQCTPLWTSKEGDMFGAPAIANGTIFESIQYFGQVFDPLVAAYSASGCGHSVCSPLWQSVDTTNGVGTFPVTVSEGTVYAVNGPYLYAYPVGGCGQATCYATWRGNAPPSINFLVTPAVSHGVAYVGTYSGQLVAFSAKGCGQSTCAPLWTTTRTQRKGQPVDTYSIASVAGDVVYVGASLLQGFGPPSHALYAFSTTCAKSPCRDLWHSNIAVSIAGTPAVANGTVYVRDYSGKVFAFAAGGCGKSGCDPLWTAQTTPTQLAPPLTVAGGVLYVLSDTHAYAFAAAGCGHSTCGSLWSVATGGSYAAGSVTVVNGRVYVPSNDGSYNGKLEVLGL